MTIKSFQGKVAVVTGAASGIGLGLCHELLARGCRVAMLDINPEVSFNAAQLSRPSALATAHVCDVSNQDAMSQVAVEIIREHGGVNLLVNNAGVSLAGAFEESSLEDFSWVIGVNLFGVVHGCYAFLPHLRRQPEAQVVNVCSSFGLLGFAKKTAYCTSKFAVRGFSESLRAELSASSIGVTLLYPGPVATNLLQQGRAYSEAQRQQELAFLSKRAISVEVVAKKTLRAVQRNTARVMISVDYHAIDWLSRFSPWLSQRVTAYTARKLPF
jgi:NAD(P)-dependent dehydrogenase (short-subunit alcohol dehydrogenase family)